jgi:hypothetical protein
MKWYNSDEFAPEHSSQIFVWDQKENKEVYIRFFGEWEFDTSNSRSFCRNFPIWRYVHDDLHPIPRNQPERSKREDKCKEDIDDRHVCVWASTCRDINHGCGKHLMRCSEHCGNTVRDK